MYTGIPVENFQGFTGMAVPSGCPCALQEFALLPIGQSTLAVFSGILYVKCAQTQAETAALANKFSIYQYVSFALQSLTSTSSLTLIQQLIGTYSNEIAKELQELAERQSEGMEDDIRKALYPQGNPSPQSDQFNWDLLLNSLASAFEVSIVLFGNGSMRFSFPIFSSESKDYPLVACFPWNQQCTAVFKPATIEGFKSQRTFLSLIRQHRCTSSILESKELSDPHYIAIKSFLQSLSSSEYELNVLFQGMDEPGQRLYGYILNQKILITCNKCLGFGIRLSCGHWLCANCQFSGSGWNPAAPSVTYCCSQPLLTKEIRLLLSEAVFSATLTNFQNAYQSSYCVGCSSIMSTGHCLQISPCAHSVCFICLLTAVKRHEPVCRLCFTYAEETHRQFLMQLLVQCSICQEQKKAVSFPAVKCSDHVVCFDCFVSTGTCPQCRRELSPAETEAVSIGFFTCVMCKQLKSRKSLFTDTCLCRICTDCIIISLKKDRHITKCPACNQKVTESTLAQFFKLYIGLMQDLHIPELEPITIKREIRKAVCHLCEVRNEDEKIRLDCGDIQHVYCLRQVLIDQQIKSQAPTCSKCHAPVAVERMPQLEQRLFKKDEERKCPKCKGATVVVDDVSYKCEGENLSFCKKCTSELGPTHTVDSCLISRRQQTTLLLKEFAQKDPKCEGCTPDGCEKCKHVAQCPVCKTPYLKASGSKEVKCVVCKTSFCFGCSSLMSPINAHGMLWHRPQCPYSARSATPNAQETIDKEEKKDNCSECTREKARCKAPIDLVPRGQFA